MPLEKSYPHKRRIDTLLQQRRLPAPVAAEVAESYRLFRTAFNTDINKEQVQALNRYRKSARRLEMTTKLLANKSKYYTSILEEMLILLSEKHVEAEISRLGLKDVKLGLGDFNCAIKVYFDPIGNFITETKRIDYCLALKIPQGLYIPIVGFEVKKYVDKTMHGTILNTVAALRACRPKTFYGAVVEDEARGVEVARNSEIWDREFVLTAQMRDNSVLHPILLKAFGRFKSTLLSKLTLGLQMIAEELEKTGALARPAQQGAVHLVMHPDSDEAPVLTEDPQGFDVADELVFGEEDQAVRACA